LLEGKTVNLRVVEKEDLPLWGDWNNNTEFFGEFIWLPQNSRMEVAKRYDGLNPDNKWFFIEKKDGKKIGGIVHYLVGNCLEIGYAMVSIERGKGYCSEAVEIMLDYLFLSKNLERVQATTDVNNLASQKVLEKAGFQKEGIIRKSSFIKGKWRDRCLFSILREEWREPRRLTKTA
jgi:RimJ/RimL family protein N-acetyltransferase